MSRRTPSARLITAGFPDRAAIYTTEIERDAEGSVTNEPTVIAADVPAQLSPVAATTEVRNADGSFVVRTYRLILQGWYPEADEAAKIVVGNRTLDVRGVDPDSWGEADDDLGWTVLIVEERSSAGGMP